MAEHDDVRTLPLDPTEDVGSARLAAALAAGDVPAIGQALRHDYVVVPLTRGPAGEPQVRVFDMGRGGYELAVFSSVASLAAFLGEAPEREFGLRRGSSLAPFIEAQRGLLRRVSFDPAGPHPMSADVEGVLAALAPQLTDDDVAWVAGTRADGAGPSPESRVYALDMPLQRDWFPVDLTDPGRLEKELSRQVRRAAGSLGAGRAVRGELTRWLVAAGESAAAGGGRFLAGVLRRHEGIVVGLSLTMYWHELGPEIGGRSHLDLLTDRLAAQPGPEITAGRTAHGPYVRHTRVSPAPDGAPVPLLVTDYWMQFPDRRGLCLLRFTSPQLVLREGLQALSEDIVHRATWVTEPA